MINPNKEISMKRKINPVKSLVKKKKKFMPKAKLINFNNLKPKTYVKPKIKK